MIRFLIRAVIFLGSAALGLWITSLILGDDFVVHANGFLVAVLVFAVLQSILSPWLFKTTTQSAGALTGAVGLISTFIALVVANLTDGLEISGTSGWIFGTLLVWVITMLGALLLPVLLVKDRVEKNRAKA